MPEAESAQAPAPALFDAGMFIGALLVEDSRHTEARPLVEQARQGVLRACTTAGILSEVYGALTWEQAKPPHNPAEACSGLDWLQWLMRLRRQLDAYGIGRAYLTAGQYDPHNARLADELALRIVVQYRFQQARLQAFELRTGIA